MWEMIRFGKQQGCSQFDMWGSLGPEPDKSDPWYGFHRFKQGYGGDLVEFVGTYDLVLQDMPYKLFRVANDIRWKFLKWKAKLT
jgi:lipid II:glycine glycyltransferase (peptidoglycan interpeptide bridge formation enzyme)